MTSLPGHHDKKVVTDVGLDGGFAGYSGFLHQLQVANLVTT